MSNLHLAGRRGNPKERLSRIVEAMVQVLGKCIKNRMMRKHSISWDPFSAGRKGNRSSMLLHKENKK